MLTNIRTRQRLTRLLIVPLALMAFMAAAKTTPALASGCRIDPVLTLSNGVTVVLYSDVSTSVADISRVQYTVHIPHGTSVTGISYPDGYGYLESVTWKADQAVSSYSAETVVTTRTGGIAVSVFESVTLSSSSYRSQIVNGSSGQSLRTLIVIPH